MDLFTILKNDHKKVKTLFKEASESESPPQDIVDEICEELTVHMQMEEKLLYPVLKKEEESEDIAVEADLEHKEAKKFMTQLKKGDLDDIERKVKLEMLQLTIEHHVEEEESEMFDSIRETLSKEQIKEISTQMTEFKAQHAKQAV